MHSEETHRFVRPSHVVNVAPPTRPSAGGLQLMCDELNVVMGRGGRRRAGGCAALPPAAADPAAWWRRDMAISEIAATGDRVCARVFVGWRGRGRRRVVFHLVDNGGEGRIFCNDYFSQKSATPALNCNGQTTLNSPTHGISNKST